MKRKHYRDVPGCPVEITLDILDGRWKGVVLFHLLDAGCLRFNELHRRVNGVTQRLLTKQLRELEEAGLVIRTVYAEVPPRVEYRLSEEGESLGPVVAMLLQWGKERLERQSIEQRANASRRASLAR